MDISDHRSTSQNSPAGIEREGQIDADVRPLKATIRITADENCPMSVVREDDTIQHVDVEEEHCTIAYKSEDIDELCETVKEREGTCHCETEVGDKRGTVQLRADRVSACICSTFKMHGCTPRIEEVSEEALTISSYFIDRSQFKDVISELQQITDSVNVVQLGNSSQTEQFRESVEIDVDTLTNKQREIFVLAMERGYFENPRKISQKELAEMLEISPSLVSRRLRAIQYKIFGQIKSVME